MKNYFLIGLAALTLLSTSCSKDSKTDSPEEGVAAMSIKLTGGTLQNRATVSPSQAEENTVIDYGVYVFNSANVLQKFRRYTSTGQQKITDLTTGPKKVVVLVNLGAEANYPAKTEGSSTYANLVSSGINFQNIPQTQAEVLASGLPMSGEATVTLQEGDGSNNSNDVTVQVYRLVAKIRLSGLTINPAVSGSLGVQLSELGIMRAVQQISVVDASNLNSGSYYKGLSDSHSTQGGSYEAKLHEDILNNYDPITGEIYFYVFPNTGSGVSDNNATLLTFVSDQAASVTNPIRYFPIVVNPVVAGGITGTDGTYIKRNTQYAIALTLQHHETGTEDPEVTVQPANISVVVNINDWAPTINQSVVWL